MSAINDFEDINLIWESLFPHLTIFELTSSEKYYYYNKYGLKLDAINILKEEENKIEGKYKKIEDEITANFIKTNHRLYELLFKIRKKYDLPSHYEKDKRFIKINKIIKENRENRHKLIIQSLDKEGKEKLSICHKLQKSFNAESYKSEKSFDDQCYPLKINNKRKLFEIYKKIGINLKY